MAAIANSLSPSASQQTADAFIAADVGGTHVRVGLLLGSGQAAAPQMLEYRKYACADYAGLADILHEFLAESGHHTVKRGVIASAGYALEDGTVITNNLPWPLSLAQIRSRLGFEDFRLVNDFEAVAHAAPQVDAHQVLQLTGPTGTALRGPVLILGPGTGLGAAVWIPTARRAVVLATEAGQAALAAGNPLEAALLTYMLSTRTHVPIEHALSGPGLMNLHVALCAVHGTTPPTYDHPGQITAAALDNSDALARQTLEVFCGLLGSVVGDMALLYGAHGGIYLAGGILPKLGPFLLQSQFAARFLNKGAMREALQRIPVKLVEHGQLGVLGAAHWYLDQIEVN